MGVWTCVRSALARITRHILDVVLKWGADAEVDKAFTKLKTVSASNSALAHSGSGRPYFYYTYKEE
jgi:hypothetical protein